VNSGKAGRFEGIIAVDGGTLDSAGWVARVEARNAGSSKGDECKYDKAGGQAA